MEEEPTNKELQKSIQDFQNENRKNFQDVLEAVNTGFNLMEDRFMEQEISILNKIEIMIDNKFDENLDSIKQEIFSVKEDIKQIKRKLKAIAKAGDEDICTVNNEVEIISKKVFKLEMQVKELQTK